jgi:hypothetical protein
MLGTYSATSHLPWPAALPRRRSRRRAAGTATTARQAARHGLRSAIQATCLSAAILAAAGAVGTARGPVVLSVPPQASATHLTVPSVTALDVAATPRTR